MRNCIFLVLLLFVFSCCWTTTTVRAERIEAPNTACTVTDLSIDCAKDDETMNQTALIDFCGGDLTGLKAAKCYMEYLCEHHDQDAVVNNKACIDTECPLATHLPVLQCDPNVPVKKTSAAAASSSNNQKKSGGGMGAGGVIAILLVLAGVGFALYTFRDKIGLGRKSSQGQPPDLAPQTAGRQLD